MAVTVITYFLVLCFVHLHFFHRIPLYAGVLITICDTFAFLLLDKYGRLISFLVLPSFTLFHAIVAIFLMLSGMLHFDTT